MSTKFTGPFERKVIDMDAYRAAPQEDEQEHTTWGEIAFLVGCCALVVAWVWFLLSHPLIAVPGVLVLLVVSLLCDVRRWRGKRYRK